MKIRVSFTIDVDEEAWSLEYGVDKSEVRQDVKSHVLNALQSDHEASDGLWREVTAN